MVRITPMFLGLDELWKNVTGQQPAHQQQGKLVWNTTLCCYACSAMIQLLRDENGWYSSEDR